MYPIVYQGRYRNSMVCRYNVVVKLVCQLGNNLIEINFLKIGSHKSDLVGQVGCSNGLPIKIKEWYFSTQEQCHLSSPKLSYVWLLDHKQENIVNWRRRKSWAGSIWWRAWWNLSRLLVASGAGARRYMELVAARSNFTGIAPTIHVPPVSGVPLVFTKMEDKKRALQPMLNYIVDGGPD